MKTEPSSPMQPEEARLASILASFFGILVAIMGAIVWVNLVGDAEANASGAVALVWFGLAALVHGLTIRRNRRIMKKPRWTYVAFLLGITSSYGIHHSLLENDAVGAVLLIPMQLFALFALWHSSWRKTVSGRL